MLRHVCAKTSRLVRSDELGLVRRLSSKPTPPADENAATAAATTATAPADTSPPPPSDADDGALAKTAEPDKAPGGLQIVNDDDEENLPPMQFEPGVAGAAQKGMSAIVIAFGAAAFGAIAWGASQALFPSASSTQTIYSEALEKVSLDSVVGNKLGTPLRAWGADRGDQRGRRTAMERWEVEEGGTEYSIVRFNVAGPLGQGRVQVQVPKKRRRGEFRYIIFDDRRRLHHVIDNRADEAAAAAAAAAATTAAANSSASSAA